MASCYWILLLWQKSNFSDRFKFEPITTNHLWFVMKILYNVVDGAPLIYIYIYIYLINDNILGKVKRRPIKLSKVFFSKKKIVQSKVLVVVHYKSTLSSLLWIKNEKETKGIKQRPNGWISVCKVSLSVQS